VKQLGSCIGCEDVHATFFSIFFDNSKYVQIVFKIKGVFAPQCQKASPPK
jgi:hypothetical protein